MWRQLVCLLFALLQADAFAGSADLAPRRPVGTSIDASSMAVVINENDPLSVAIGEYYQTRRGIPADNMIRVRFDGSRNAISATEFHRVRTQAETKTPRRVQAYALAWLKPYRVQCASITSAFTFGFSLSLCATGCDITKLNPYFDSDSKQPHEAFGLRPAMLLAARDIVQARELIDRGVAADGSMPEGTAYLVSTPDPKRNVRAGAYRNAVLMARHRIRVEPVEAVALEGRSDVMFYFTGLVEVPGIDTNRYLPGAVADHLTSAGGDLLGSSQMSSLRWLEAGATGSYGTVVEPCNLPAKFPNPGILMKHYLDGETLIEAYWKSVAMPGQGLFIGEPLSSPYAQRLTHFGPD